METTSETETRELLKIGSISRSRQDKQANSHNADLGEQIVAHRRFCQMPINKLMLASLAGTNMFQNRINGFIPNVSVPSFSTSLMAAARDERPTASLPQAVQTMDIYQAAMNRAIEEHELDKLFNPDFYDYQI